MKKRREFVAIGYSYSESSDSKCMSFVGENDVQNLRLSSTDLGVFVDYSETSSSLSLEGAGLIGRVGWLYLGVCRTEIS